MNLEQKNALQVPQGGSWGVASHIAIVNAVIRNDLEQVTDIQLIESTYEGTVNYVRTYSLAGGYIARPYHIVRLRKAQ